MQSLPISLQKVMQGEIRAFRSMDYILPEIIDRRGPVDHVSPEERTKYNPRLPKRVALPILKFPEALRIQFEQGLKEYDNTIHRDKQIQMIQFRRQLLKILAHKDIDLPPVTTDIEDAIKFSKRKFTYRAELESKMSQMVAIEAVRKDMSVMAMEQMPLRPGKGGFPYFPSFLYIVQKLRAAVALKGKDNDLYGTSWDWSWNDIVTRKYQSGGIFTYFTYRSEKYVFYQTTSYFFWYRIGDEKAILGDMDTFDYVLSHSEITFNLKMILAVGEYENLRKPIELLLQVEDMEIPYNNKVTILKNFESICLMMSDIINANFISWAPIHDTMEALVSAVNDSPAEQEELIRLYQIMLRVLNHRDDKSWIATLIRELRELDGRALQELSTIHKFFYYAQVDEEAGVKKYLKRVHTNRPYNPEMIDALVDLAKREFMINYENRHGFLPNIEAPEEKYVLIKQKASMKDMKSLNSLPLTFFRDINIVESLSKPSTHDPIEKAKDKGALKEEITFGPGDSKKELLQIIDRETYELKKLPLSDYKERVEPEVYLTRQQRVATRVPNPTRLIPKEREQKIEARLFGNTTIENKHGLSYYMDMLKVVLSYFNGELMTISDKDRKQKLHVAGQYLKRPNYYAMMLDIEGHNQSMQLGNVGPLAEFCGKLFGEEGWYYLSNYFNHLTVYNYGIYDSTVTVSKGQVGGIEGWQNPLWTLHTTLVTHLMTLELQLNVPNFMVYSDDVAIITELNINTQDQLDELFEQLVDFYFNFGMCVKPAQTVVSKNRVTILRNHYYEGTLSDSTIKRLISSSSFNDDQLVSEEIEVLALDSSISSAMENTNHLLTCMLMKWYKAILLTGRTMVALLEQERSNSFLNHDLIDVQIKSLIRYYTLQDNTAWVTKDMRAKNTIEEIKQMSKKVGFNNPTTNDIVDLLREEYGEPMADKVKRMKVDLFFYLIKQKVILQELLIFRMIMPSNLGGFGVSLTINQALSGHSSGFLKQLTYARKMIEMTFSEQEFFLDIMSHSLGNKRKDGNLKSELALLSTEYPMQNYIESATGKINNAIRSFITKRTKNKKVKELLQLEANRSAFKEDLINYTRDRFSYRITRFYYEHSKYHILDLLISKIESSRGFLKLISNITTLRSELFRMNLNNGIGLFRKADSGVIQIEEDVDLLQIIMDKQEIDYPAVKQVKIREPLYETILEECNPRKYLIASHYHQGTKIEDGFEVFLGPEFGNEALYKGAETERHLLFEHIEQTLTLKVLMMTKWILSNCKKAGSDITSDANCNILLMANHTLETLNAPSYSELQSLVQLPTGGEILHRLPNMQFRTASHVRVLPAEIIKVSTMINQQKVYEYNLEDSNVNFDYLRMRIKLAAAIRYTYNIRPKFMMHFDFKENDLVHDVRIDFCTLAGKSKRIDVFNYSKFDYHPLDIRETRAICETYFTEENETKANSRPAILLLGNIATGIMKNRNMIIFEEFNKLRQEHVYVDTVLTVYTSWIPFIRRYKNLFSDWTQMTDLQVYNSIITELKDTIRDKLATRVQLAQHIDKAILVSLLEEEFGLQEIMSDAYMMDLYRSMKYMAGQYIKKKHQLEKGMIIKHIRLNTTLYRTAIEKVAYYLLIHNCLKIEMDTSGPYLNELETMINVDHLEVIWKEIIDVERPQYFAMFVFGKDAIFRHLEKHVFKMVQSISNAISQIDIEEITVIKMQEGKDTHTPLEYSETHPTEVLSMTYNKVRIDNSFITNVTEYQNLFKFIRNVSATYADPASYYSPTGSDSFVSNHGLFTRLVREGMIDKDTTICDLTGGRGDGNIAMKGLGLNVESFTREGIFTNIKRIGEINSIKELDIFNQESLMFTLHYDWIHIDISNIKYTNRSIDDTLKFYMNNNKKISIRINAVYKLISDKASVFSDPKYNYYIMAPNASGLLPHQIYLVMHPEETPIRIESNKLSDSNMYRMLARPYARMIRYKNLNARTNTIYNNSVLDIIPEDLKLTDVLFKLDDFLIDDKILLSINKVRKNWIFISDISMNLEGMKKSDATYFKDCTAKEYTVDYKGYEVDETIIGYPKKHLKYKYLKKHLQHMHTRYGTPINVRVNEMSLQQLDIIKRVHPINEVRATVSAYCVLIRNSIDVRKMSLRELVEKKQEYTDTLATYHTEWSKSLKNAVLMIAYAAMRRSYQSGIDLLWAKLHGDYAHRKQVRTEIEIYRKLTGLYKKWEEQAFLSLETIKATRRIGNHIMKKLKDRKRDKVVPADKGLVDKFAGLAEVFNDQFFESLAQQLLDFKFSEDIIYTDVIEDIIPKADTKEEDIFISAADIGSGLAKLIDTKPLTDKLREIGARDGDIAVFARDTADTLWEAEGSDDDEGAAWGDF